MNQASSRSSRPSLWLGIIVFLFVACLVVMIATVRTLILPEVFTSTCRLKLDPLSLARYVHPSAGESITVDARLIRTEVETMKSAKVLVPAIEALHLGKVWAEQFGIRGALRTPESLRMLRRMLHIGAVENSLVVEVNAWASDPDMASTIANAIGESYLQYVAAHPEGIQAAFIDRAYPRLKPVMPNHSSNIAFGVAVGVVIGLPCGLLTYWLERRWQRSKPVATEPHPPEVVAASSGTPTNSSLPLNRRF